MTPEWLSRTELLIGKNNITKLQKAHILIVGLGGVGAYAAEQICRAGIGAITIVDGDIVQSTNRNRQLLALISNEEILKTDVLAKRLSDINPELKLNIINEFIKDEKEVEILKMAKYDYVIDAIDTLSPKIFLIYHSIKNNYKIVSSMGAGGKSDPSQVKIADISESYNCRLAFYIRKKLRKLGVSSGFKVVFSPEKIKGEMFLTENEQNKKSTIGTISYMPPIFGCYCASVVINDIIGVRF
ncbi:MAG: tRNA threonylcarbamoyladenosine dehydratase [Bacteroidales bacterium]|nr:tRNA threonylcarbamoyladenosine dehydratase [Bacteroidales bacterium]